MPLRLSSITFTGGEAIDVEAADIVVVVGSNNAGKTRTLAEVQLLLSQMPGHIRRRSEYLAVDAVGVAKSSSVDELKQWITSNRYTYDQWTGNHDRPMFRTVGAGGELPLDEIPHWWTESDRLGSLAGHLVHGLFAGNRLGLFGGSASRLQRGNHPDAPIQRLVADDQIRDAFSRSLYAAFGWHVVIDGWSPQLTLYVSDEPQSAFRASSDTGLPPPELEERFGQLRGLAEQSDGVRSFAGILLTLLVTPFPVLLIDEPEAFLHPPQARLLGRFLRELRQDGQIVVATHDLDIVVGLLSDGGSNPSSSRVQVIRLERQGDDVHAFSLSPEEVLRLWQDPIFRFSRALDGLFHDGVVVVEGDADGRFYGVVSGAIAGTPQAPASSDGTAETRSPDVMFLPAGGKQRIPRVVSALRSASTPVRVIGDFDVLNDERVLLDICSALGAKDDLLSEVKGLRRTIDSNVRGSERRRTREQFESELHEVFNTIDDSDELSRDTRSRIARLLRPQGGWAAAKEIGKAAVPRGEATERLDELLALLEGIGLHIVATGAVESLVSEVGGKGAAWVIEVIDRGLVESADQAQELVAAVLNGFQPLSIPLGPRTTK